ncbi:MAG: alcohol dehydrogenase catalytic domain-containing protein, partial [Acidobacteria bacterium]|nr:alcohol dehydrogenase catalytic domain-containing protein [Acidobacteriota bacterium]
MKAGVLLGANQMEVRDVEEPTLSNHEVMIQPVRAGVCGSDVSMYVGHRQPPYFPFIIGHEVVGLVTAVAPGVTKVAVGQRVVVEPNYTCGTCKFCLSGRGNICPNKKSTGVSVPGIFADYASVPAEFTWPVPDTISDADAASIEPLAVSLHALLQSGARAGDTVAVVGCGVVGLLLIHVAVAKGVRVLAHDRFPEKLDMAAHLGAKAVNTDDVAGLWKEENVSTIFECAGVSSTTELSIGSAPRGSKVMLLGLSTAPASFVPLRLVREGIRIEPSLIYDHPGDFMEAIRLVADKTLSPGMIVTETLPFASIG